MNDKTINLRAHHLLCSVLYKGKGYSEHFNENMTMITQSLKDGCNLMLRTNPDEICKECPNKLPDGNCMLDNEEKDGDIKSLDRLVLDRFSLKSDCEYNSAEAFSLIRDNITEADFDSWCSKCRWREEGLCSYLEYMERINIFIPE